MTDLTGTISAKSDQMNADDLIGKSLTIKVTKVSIASGEQPIAINYEGDGGKPFMPCKTMRRVLVKIWGSDGNAYIGRSMTLYRDDTVTFGGQQVGGIRISHMSDISSPITMSLTATKKSKKPVTIKPLEKSTPKPEAISESTDLEKNGAAAASKGIEAYKTWKNGLSDKEKESLVSFHSKWVKIAKEADAKSPVS